MKGMIQWLHRFLYRKPPLLLLPLAAASALVLSLLLQPGPDRAAADHAPAGNPLAIGAGVAVAADDAYVFGNAFTPNEVTVHVGDSVKWTLNSFEVHSVTFGQGPAGAPPPTWPNTFNLPPGPPPANLNVGTATYSGIEFINTGLIGNGSTVTIGFTAKGDFPYICTIHAGLGMVGVVHVVDSGADADTQAEADARAQAQAQAILDLEEPLEDQTLTQKFQSLQRPDGSRLWTVPLGPFQQTATGYLELALFFPTDISIGQGDTIRWESPTPHTTTFLQPGQDPATVNPFSPPAKPSAVYDGTSLYNSGIFAFGPPPQQIKSFELTFDKVGKVPYLCLLHFRQGMTGTVTVTARSPGGIPLKAGWNNVPFLGPSDKDAMDAFANLIAAGALDVAHHWAADLGIWHSFDPKAPPAINTLHEVEPGDVLWIHVNKDIDWEPDP